MRSQSSYRCVLVVDAIRGSASCCEFFDVFHRVVRDSFPLRRIELNNDFRIV